jgi:hypothetical protein
MEDSAMEFLVATDADVDDVTSNGRNTEWRFHTSNMKDLRTRVDTLIADAFGIDLHDLDYYDYYRDRLPSLPSASVEYAMVGVRFLVERAIANMHRFVNSLEGSRSNVVRFVHDAKRILHEFDRIRGSHQGTCDVNLVFQIRSMIIHSSLVNEDYRILIGSVDGDRRHSGLDHWTTFYMESYSCRFDFVFVLMYECEFQEECYGIIDRSDTGRCRYRRRFGKDLYRNEMLDKDFARFDDFADEVEVNVFDRYHLWESGAGLDGEESTGEHLILRIITLDIIASRIQKAWRRWRDKKRTDV